MKVKQKRKLIFKRDRGNITPTKRVVAVIVVGWCVTFLIFSDFVLMYEELFTCCGCLVMLQRFINCTAYFCQREHRHHADSADIGSGANEFRAQS